MSYGSINASPKSVGNVDSTASLSQQSEPTSHSVLGAGERAASTENERAAETQHLSWLQTVQSFYNRNFGLFLVLLAQVFGSLMTMSTKLLETSFETKFHALQIIFARMLATAACALFYMWYKAVPEAPFGPRNVRGLLVLRGMAGFAGLFGAYFISFLTPILTAFICFVALKEPFTVTEALAGIVALVGVFLIARPQFIFADLDSLPQPSNSTNDTVKGNSVPEVPVSPAQRSAAVLSAMAGAFFAATAYSIIRVIGKRAHSLISVNYFAMLATLVSCLIILLHPELHFEIPQSLLQWLLLVAIGISGFLLQFLLTEGLQREKGGRATNMIYTQLVFALIFEKLVWGTTPAPLSLCGGALIITGALWSGLQRNKPADNSTRPAPNDEERRLLANNHEDSRDTRTS